MARLKTQVNGSNRIEAADVQVMGPTLDPRYTDDGAVSLLVDEIGDGFKASFDPGAFSLHDGRKRNGHLFQGDCRDTLFFIYTV